MANYPAHPLDGDPTTRGASFRQDGTPTQKIVVKGGAGRQQLRPQEVPALRGGRCNPEAIEAGEPQELVGTSTAAERGYEHGECLLP